MNRVLTNVICLEQKLEACFLGSGDVDNVVGATMQHVKSTASKGCFGGVADVSNLYAHRVSGLR